MTTRPQPARRPLSIDLEVFDDDVDERGPAASLVASADAVEARTTGPHPSAAAAAGTVTKGVGGGLAVGGIGAAILTLDRVLRDHGETLETLTAAGPLTAALLQNWPLLLFGFVVWRFVAARWTEYTARQKQQNALTAKDRRATLKVLRLVAAETDRVAVEIGALRSDLATVRELAAATDSRTRDETARLRQHVDDALTDLRGRVGRVESRPSP